MMSFYKGLESRPTFCYTDTVRSTDAVIDVFDMRALQGVGAMAIEAVGPASRAELNEESRGRYADVIRVAAAIAGGFAADGELRPEDATWIADMAGAVVIQCERVCGIGGDA